MNNLQVVEYENVRVVTTKQIAEVYGTTSDVITKNFNRNKDKYVEGKHYLALEGEDKKKFLDQGQIVRGLKNAKVVYLWTDKGALLIAKSLNTDKAWEAYERLIDFYFYVKENPEQAIKQMTNPQQVESTEPRTLPTITNWYGRHKPLIDEVKKKYGIDTKTLYSGLSIRLSSVYNMSVARTYYKKDLGVYPRYLMDLVEHFPQIQDEAEKYLNELLEKKTE